MGDNTVVTGNDASTDVSTDQSIPVDSGSDTTTDATDAQSDVVDAAKINELYLVASTGGMTPTTSIEVIDLAQGKAVRDQQFSGIVALAYSAGSLYVVRGQGQQRISVVDPVALTVTSTITLAWDPTGAVFSADGTVVYLTRGAGYIEQVKLPAGSLTGEIQVPAPSGEGGTAQPLGIALNHAQTQLGVTNDFDQACVATVNIAGTTLSVGSNIIPPAIVNSNCLRQNDQLAFSVDDARLATWDTNCGTIDVYNTADLSRDATASAQYTRPSGSALGSIIYDNIANVWAVNVDTLYRAPTAGGSTSYVTTANTWALLTTDVPFTTLWAIAYDPHNDGIFTVDPTTATTTRELWDLSLIPSSANITHAIYVSR